jgi:hypothetical protein
MTKPFFPFLRAGVALLSLFSLGACGTTTGAASARNILIPTAVGAATGTVVTVATAGCIPCGAAIGGAAGAGVGLIYDRLDNRTPGR